MRRIVVVTTLTLVLAGLLSGLSQAGEVKFALTGDNTKVTFIGRKPGAKHDGAFKKLTGTATVNGTDLTTLKIALDIDLNALTTDNEKVTAHLKTPDFFDVKNNPTAKFASTKIDKTADGYTVAGKLTMHGKTKEISFPAKIAVDGGNLTITSSFNINRHDWGISYGKGMVEDDVSLTVAVSTKK